MSVNFKKTLSAAIFTTAMALGLAAFPAFGAEIADECTLAGAAGYFARGGGCIVMKNRDRNTRFVQALDFVKSDGGYFFIGVRNAGANESQSMAYTMGINEKGLICVSSSPPNKINFDFRGRKYAVYHPGRILSSVATVDEFVAKILKAGKLGGAMNYLVADGRKLCLVEVVDEMHYDYEIVVNGTLCQTNHYHLDKMTPYQGTPLNPSSAARLARVKTLVGEREGPLDAADFMAIAADHGSQDGEYNDSTVCRHPDLVYGAKKFDGGTISSMIMVSRPGRPPLAFVAMGQPCSTGFEKFIITDGDCKINPLKKALYKSGAVNMAADFKRDVYYHFIMPFLKR